MTAIVARWQDATGSLPDRLKKALLYVPAGFVLGLVFLGYFEPTKEEHSRPLAIFRSAALAR